MRYTFVLDLNEKKKKKGLKSRNIFLVNLARYILNVLTSILIQLYLEKYQKNIEIPNAFKNSYQTKKSRTFSKYSLCLEQTTGCGSFSLECSCFSFTLSATLCSLVQAQCRFLLVCFPVPQDHLSNCCGPCMQMEKRIFQHSQGKRKKSVLR